MKIVKILCLLMLSLYNVAAFGQEADSVINTTAIIGKEFTLIAPSQYYSSYQWLLPDGSTREGKTINTTLNRYGVQTFQCIARDNCMDNITYFFVDVKALGRSVKITEDIKVYPIPATNVVNIKLPQNTSCSIKFLDLNGRTLEEKEITNEDLVTLDVQRYTSGVYLLQIIEAENIQYQKILVQK